jgi:hypothetical protein
MNMDNPNTTTKEEGSCYEYGCCDDTPDMPSTNFTVSPIKHHASSSDGFKTPVSNKFEAEGSFGSCTPKEQELSNSLSNLKWGFKKRYAETCQSFCAYCNYYIVFVICYYDTAGSRGCLTNWHNTKKRCTPYIHYIYK